MPSALTDGDEEQVSEFRKLIFRPLTILVLVLLVGLGVAIAVTSSPLFAVLPLLAGLGYFWIKAGRRSQDAFFTSYATSHDLARVPDGQLPPVAPLFRKGNNKKTLQYLKGDLGNKCDGVLALYQYTLGGGQESTDWPFTVIMVQMPEAVGLLGDILVQEQVSSDARQGFERVTLESQAMDDRYRIFARGQDPVVVRQIFSPVFINWMIEVAEDGFAFDLENGVLCVYASGHRQDTASLEAFTATSVHLASRLADEMVSRA